MQQKRSFHISGLLNSIRVLFVLFAAYCLVSSCNDEKSDDDNLPEYPEVNRMDKLPADIAKRGPETDQYPPVLHSDEYQEPIPLSSVINTAGAEDSPFILPDGRTLYFFFTPDVRIPVEQQLLDSVTGVWVSSKIGNSWIEAERLWLQDPGKLSLDGAVAIQDDEMWFASAREGYNGVNMFTAKYIGGKWTSWTYSGDRLMKEIQIGEVHIQGDDLYFHSGRAGGFGSYDIWVTTRSGDTWSDPVNIEEVNSADMEGWPYVSSDGTELWFTRFYQGSPAIFRSVKFKGIWGEPELILSQFAGEPTLDDDGNIYFVHHYYEEGVMIEADIYVAYKKITPE
jgi:hypothetical protein